MKDPVSTLEILCGCGWGNLAYPVKEGETPVCPVCGHVFPEFTGEEHDCEDEKEIHYFDPSEARSEGDSEFGTYAECGVCGRAMDTHGRREQ